MRATTLLIAAVAAALLASTAYSAVCVTPAANRRYYTLSSAVQNCDAVRSCREALCDCSGLPSTCTVPTYATNRCSAGFQCMRTYMACITSAAENASATSGATCSTWGASISNLRSSFVASLSTDWIGADVYKACTYQACALINNVNCSDASLFMCPRPAGAQTATPTPLTAVATAAPNQRKAEVKAAAAFQGDFSQLFAPGMEAALENFCTVAATAFANKIGLGAGLFRKLCRQGSLEVELTIETAADDTSLQDAITNNAANINEDTDTTWLDALQTSIATECPTCSVTIEAPIVVTAVALEATPEPEPNTDVEQTCGSGCVAGVIVGVAVLVIIIISVVKIVVKKVSKGTEKTPASHEPTSSV